jgi:hypothetical protein
MLGIRRSGELRGVQTSSLGMGGARRMARVEVVRADGTRRLVAVVDRERPGIDAVDSLARLCLTLRRAGAEARVEVLSDDLAQLLDLAGLGREVGGKVEQGEHPLGLEEGVDPGDLAP